MFSLAKHDYAHLLSSDPRDRRRWDLDAEHDHR